MTDKVSIGTIAANGEYYAVECNECGARSRDAGKLGDEHDSLFCDDGGEWVEFE